MVKEFFCKALEDVYLKLESCSRCTRPEGGSKSKMNELKTGKIEILIKNVQTGKL